MRTERVREDDFVAAERGRVALVGGLDVGVEQPADGGQVLAELEQDGPGATGGAVRVTDADAFAHLGLEVLDNRGDTLGG